jgi:serine/threonine-protein kinase
MGVVLLVEREGQLHAMKIIRRGAGGAGGKDVARFIEKVEILSSINHSNVVGVLEYGISGSGGGVEGEDGVPYLVMEFVPGSPLNHIAVEERDMGWKLSILAQVAYGLDALHSYGLVHRDIKPGNILVMGDGTAKLGDFGVTGVVDAELGVVMGAFGSPAYMAPEAFDPTRPKDKSADIFSLGVVAYELLTGVKPFFGANIREMRGAIQGADPIEPKALEPDIGEELQATIAGMLEKEPDRRIHSAAEVARCFSGEDKNGRDRKRSVWRGEER